tara:strand:+ start:2082 stop:2297 length:216 start_codon:yes stop_codon:yes gene_type:complete
MLVLQVEGVHYDVREIGDDLWLVRFEDQKPVAMVAKFNNKPGADGFEKYLHQMASIVENLEMEEEDGQVLH